MAYLEITDAFSSLAQFESLPAPSAGNYVIEDSVYSYFGSLTNTGTLASKTNLNILGTYATISALNAAHPSGSGGEVYIVGSGSQAHYYVFSAISGGVYLDTGSTTTGGTTTGGTTPESPVCFVAGTRILTPEGYKAVETLKRGSLVMTADGRAVPAKIYYMEFKKTTAVTAPYTIPAGTFGLKTELTVSPLHAFQMRKGVWMIPAVAAKISSAVVQKSIGKPIVYYHVECPQYLRDNLVVDGIVVESYGSPQMKGLETPYTWCRSLKGFTRASPAVLKNIATQ
jgi:hypothetical protein